MYFQKRRNNKFNAKSTIYNGDYYDSKMEAGYAMELDLRKKAGDIKDWERQVPIDLYVNGMKICTYKLDFKIIHNNDSEELVEVKGMETYAWRLKWKLLEAIYTKDHPEITLTLVK